MHLQDVFLLENYTVLSENRNGNPVLRVKGIFQRADEANCNKRRYPKKVLESQIKKLNEAINERRLVGELDHPTYDVVKLSNASHLITNLYMENGEVIGEAEILPTPAGKVVEGLIKGGVKIGISSRGIGSLTENNDGTKTVNEDFNLLTFDIVADPSTRGAFPALMESTEIEYNKAFVESTVKKVYGERALLKMLEKKIDEKINEAKKSEGQKEKNITPLKVDPKTARQRAEAEHKAKVRNYLNKPYAGPNMSKWKSEGLPEGNEQSKQVGRQFAKMIAKRRSGETQGATPKNLKLKAKAVGQKAAGKQIDLNSKQIINFKNKVICELSKGTLQSYRDKATSQDPTQTPMKREVGISKASTKITKAAQGKNTKKSTMGGKPTQSSTSAYGGKAGDSSKQSKPMARSEINKAKSSGQEGAKASANDKAFSKLVKGLSKKS